VASFGRPLFFYTFTGNFIVMKTRIFTLVFCGFLLPGILLANNLISEKEATTVARNFYYERINQMEKINLDEILIDEIKLISNADQDLYYAINLHKGFVLISAAKNTYPVLAYGFDGKFVQPGETSNTAAWLGQYERQIAAAIQNKSQASDATKATWEKYLDPDFFKNNPTNNIRTVEPMLVSKWDQGLYYNAACPADPGGVGGHCVTGCVATALGQLVYYFRFPQSGTGYYSYDDPNYGTIAADFGAANYDYEQMMNELSDPNPEVAELIFHLGVACDMVYGPQSSGMYNHKAAYALKSFFRYSPETQYIYRDSTNMNWDSLMIAHLDLKIPMYYAGWSVPNINGHAFIVDGYQDEHFYHFNWGWGGSNDGYFYTEELSPGGNNFNLAQELIIHAFPDTLSYTYPDFCSGSKNISTMRGTFTDGSYPVYNYQNNADCQWLIDPQNMQDSVTNITLSFQRFWLDSLSDFINVYDGENTSAPLLVSLVGNTLPNPISSTGNKMLVTFTSDNQNTAPGFLASFESQQPSWCAGTTVKLEQQGIFNDGSHQFFYNNSSTCMWQIMPVGANEVTVYFTSFDIEEGQDHVKIYDTQTMDLLADYSGYYPPDAPPPPVSSQSGKIFFIFHSDASGRAQGWEAGYYSDLVGIDTPGQETDFYIYPNPAKDILYLDLTERHNETVHVVLINSLGKVALDRIFPNGSSGKLSLDISTFTKGLYILRCKSGNETFMKKVMIVASQ